MASITINSANVIQACEKQLIKIREIYNVKLKRWEKKYSNRSIFLPSPPPVPSLCSDQRDQACNIKELAEYKRSQPPIGHAGTVDIDHNDFQLIGEFLTMTPEPKP